jgi:hypothetical protein
MSGGGSKRATSGSPAALSPGREGASDQVLSLIGFPGGGDWLTAIRGQRFCLCIRWLAARI